MPFVAGAVIGAIELRYDQAVKALKAVQEQTKRSMDRMTKSVQAHQAQIRGLGIAMAGAGAGALLMTRSFLTAAGQMERYEAQFRVLTGSAEAAEARLKELVDFAAKTPFDLPGIVEADIMVQAMNLSLGTISETMTIFGDTAAAMNQPMSRVIATLAKLKAGMFETEQVAVNLGLVKEDFAALGVEFTKTGEVINRQALFPAAIELIGRFRGTMEETSKTLEGRLSNLRDSFFQLQVAIGEGLLPEGKDLIEQLTETIDTIGVWVRENPALAKSVATVTLKVGLLSAAIGAILLVLPQLLAGIGAVVAIMTGPAGLIILLAAATAGVWAMQKASEALADSIDRVARARMLGPVAQLPEVERAAEAYQKLRAAEEALAAGPVYRGSANLLQKAVESARKEYEKARDAADRAVTAYDSVAGAIDKTTTATTAGASTTAAFKTRLDKARESVKELAKELSLLTKGTTAYNETAAELADAQAEVNRLTRVGANEWAGYVEAGDNVIAMWDRMKTAVISAVDVYKWAYVNEIAPGMENWADLFEDLVGAGTDIFTRMEEGADDVDRAVREHLTKGLENAIEVAQRLSLAFAGMAMGPPGTGITAWALGLKSLPEEAEESARDIIDTYGTMWERIQGQWAEGLGRLVSSFRDFGDVISQLAEMVKQTIFEMLSRELVEELQQGIAAGIQARRQKQANAAFAQELAGQQASTKLTQSMNAWTAAANALPAPFGQWVGAALQTLVASGTQASAATTNLGAAATSASASALAQTAAATNITAGGVMVGAAETMLLAADRMAKAAEAAGGGGKVGAGGGGNILSGSILGAILGLPFLQHGGIVRRPTLAMMGEAGPEAIIPLPRIPTRPTIPSLPSLAMATAGGGGAPEQLMGPIHIHQTNYLAVAGLPELEFRRLARRAVDSLGDEITRYTRRMGR